jgi:hypothetical protein
MLENWFNIPNYEGFYQASDQGNIRSLDRQVAYGRHDGGCFYLGRVLRKTKLKKGYLSVKLAKEGVKKTRYVHELILLACIGKRPFTIDRGEIRHLNGDKDDNRLANLSYGTVKENAADRVRHKLGGLT